MTALQNVVTTEDVADVFGNVLAKDKIHKISLGLGVAASL